jgi:hypothetical protein
VRACSFANPTDENAAEKGQPKEKAMGALEGKIAVITGGNSCPGYGQAVRGRRGVRFYHRATASGVG